MFFYEYKVKYWNEIGKIEEECYGIIYGENLYEIGEKIESYYGENLIEITISPTPEESCYEFEHNLQEEPSDMVKNIIYLKKSKEKGGS